MRVGILGNPRAGRGRGERVAHAIADRLSHEGHRVELALTTDGPDRARRLAQGSEALVIAGGDGTLHHALPILIESRVPVYHAGLGTENLFARHVGHRPDPDAIAEALRRFNTRDLDVGHIPGSDGSPGTYFVLMASIGPDAAVVHRLARERAGPIRHHSYLRPVLAEMIDPTLPRLTIRADGKILAERERGWLVVANAPPYALKIDPLPQADPADGLLDVLFLPADDAPTLLAALVALRFRANPASLGGRIARTSRLQVRVDPATAPVQLDGEAVDVRIMSGIGSDWSWEALVTIRQGILRSIVL